MINPSPDDNQGEGNKTENMMRKQQSRSNSKDPFATPKITRTPSPSPYYLDSNAAAVSRPHGSHRSLNTPQTGLRSHSLDWRQRRLDQTNSHSRTNYNRHYPPSVPAVSNLDSFSGVTPNTGNRLNTTSSNARHNVNNNTSYNTSVATSFGSSPLFSPFSDESEYIDTPRSQNYMYGTHNTQAGNINKVPTDVGNNKKRGKRNVGIQYGNGKDRPTTFLQCLMGQDSELEEKPFIYTAIWLICIGLILSFLIFIIVICFLLLYEMKHKILIH